MIRRVLLLLVLLAPTPAAAGQPPSDPVAVMPFKNLNDDAELNWLRVGIAETMISDLRKSRALRVVERDQLDRALAEIELQGRRGSEVSTAAQAGKIVGARTVVLGGFQKAGHKIRITARFVAVQTGLVQDTAKVTGPMKNIFGLQDRIVARLLKKKTGKKKLGLRKRRQGSQSMVTAYRLYALSLSAVSRADRVKYLKQSLEVDPGFSYAVEDLDALEKRLDRYRHEAQKRQVEEAAELRRLFEEQKLEPEEKSQRAFMLLSKHFSSLRYRALLADATFVMGQDLPPYGTISVREYASFSQFQAHQMLKHYDLALQIGERHLKEFPGGTYFLSVEMGMRSLMRLLRQRQEGKAAVKKKLTEIEEDRKEALEKAQQRKREVSPVRLRGLDFQRCTAMQSNAQYERTLVECAAFVAKHAADPDENAQSLVGIAKWNQVLALAELGRFDEARERALGMKQADPEFARQYSVDTVMMTWPRD